MSRKAPVWLALAALAACGPSADEGAQDPAAAGVSAAAPEVHFPRYRPPGAGGPEAFMEAGIGGTLALRGPCLGFASESEFQTVVWPAEARLGSDAEGLFVAAGGERFRLGEFLIGGGGSMSADNIDRRLETPFPADCDRAGAVELHSFRRSEEGFGEPEPAPPPPPR